MKATRVAKEGLAVALALLRLASVATDAFPPLKSAAGSALHIADLVSVGVTVLSSRECELRLLLEISLK